MASHRSSRPVGFFLPGFPVLRFNDLSFTSSPLVIRQPRGYAGTEKSRGSAERRLAAIGCNSPQIGERNILPDVRLSDNLLLQLVRTLGSSPTIRTSCWNLRYRHAPSKRTPSPDM